MTPLEAARAAKRNLAARAVTHTCPHCKAEAVTYVRCEVYHRCPKRSGPRAQLVRFDQ